MTLFPEHVKNVAIQLTYEEQQTFKELFRVYLQEQLNVANTRKLRGTPVRKDGVEWIKRHMRDIENLHDKFFATMGYPATPEQFRKSNEVKL